jgi:hypothetical protein
MTNPTRHSTESLTLWITRSSRVAWAPILVFAIHVILAKVFDVYTHFPNIDIAMHFFGGVGITYFLLRSATVAVDLNFLGSPSRAAVALLTFFAASTTTILWEFFEWIFDHSFQRQFQAGLNDTMLDMLMGMLGSIVYLVLTHALSRRSSNSTINGR